MSKKSLLFYTFKCLVNKFQILLNCAAGLEVQDTCSNPALAQTAVMDLYQDLQSRQNWCSSNRSQVNTLSFWTILCTYVLFHYQSKSTEQKKIQGLIVNISDCFASQIMSGLIHVITLQKCLNPPPWLHCWFPLSKMVSCLCGGLKATGTLCFLF